MVTSIIGEDATNQNGYLASLSETEIALDKQSRATTSNSADALVNQDLKLSRRKSLRFRKIDDWASSSTLSQENS